MSRLRRTVARRLVESQQRSALLSTFQEIEMTALLDLRRRWGPAFEERHGTSLGIMSFFVKAVIEALKEVPELNAEISGDDIVYHHRYHVGIAVGSERGLVVPVLRDADRMSLAAIEEAIDDFAERAETGALELDELRDGTFTITNGGVFGSLLSTPIVNPPQSGVLGMHAIEERPIARDGAVAVRPMMYTALTYDHRIVDGRESVRFLMRVKELIEAPERLLLEA
jgi:2-oxoglutarate dehydrogenase E2 component (dihydrolipoamide succinyltransferase)